ncbi:MAG: cytochrome C [Calditerrivibrio sp.]|nr:cytochrome C [Calditerrivibrio sp.]
MKFFKFVILLSIMAILATTPVFSKTKAKPAGKHPIPMGNQNCESCHVGTVQYQQWEKSGHGLGLVKCEVCHGEETTFKKVPENAVCVKCHSTQFESLTKKNIPCITCHPAHTFNAHKLNK